MMIRRMNGPKMFFRLLDMSMCCFQTSTKRAGFPREDDADSAAHSYQRWCHWWSLSAGRMAPWQRRGNEVFSAPGQRGELLTQ